MTVQGTDSITITGISVTDLTNTSGIVSRDNIKIFREVYITITTPSNPEGRPGPWSNALVPNKDLFFNESKNAFPATVPVGQSQAFWIDVFIPESAAPGRLALCKGGTDESGDAEQPHQGGRVYTLATTAEYGLE